jgi:hypothetical protein
VRSHSQNLVALMLSLIVIISTAQTAGIVPRPVSADNTLSLQIARSPATAEYQTSSGQTGNPATTAAMGQARIRVDPSSKTINAGTFARFNIQVILNTSAEVFLAANGAPPHVVTIFTLDHGVASPEFHSSLTILTSDDTPIGPYSITVIAIVNGTRIPDANVSLEIVSPSVTTNTPTTISAGASLVVSVSTDQDQYKQNASVSLRGQVTDGTGGTVNDATVALQVDGPNGAEIASAKLATDLSGVFSFKIPENATNKAGTYTIFASATKSGYTGATTRTTFVAGTSLTPSVVIKDIYMTDLPGNRSVIFTPGQTVLVWVAVANSGAAFDGVVWVQIRDPKDTPVWIQFQISRLETGQTVKVAFSFQTTSAMRPGLYSANVLVSDMLISHGGIFLASAHSEFAIAS